MLKTSALETYYSGQCTLSTHAVVKPSYLLISLPLPPPPMQHCNPPPLINLMIGSLLTPVEGCDFVTLHNYNCARHIWCSLSKSFFILFTYFRIIRGGNASNCSKVVSWNYIVRSFSWNLSLFCFFIVVTEGIRSECMLKKKKIAKFSNLYKIT